MLDNLIDCFLKMTIVDISNNAALRCEAVRDAPPRRRCNPCNIKQVKIEPEAELHYSSAPQVTVQAMLDAATPNLTVPAKHSVTT
jgi:hypothetical protein